MTHTEISSQIRYHSDGGLFEWVKASGGRRRGTFAGSANKEGYLFVMVNGQKYSAHRLAWFLFYGMWPNGQIDHINRVKADNRIENLRDVSGAINSRNQVDAQSNNKVGVLGVSPARNKFSASIKKDGIKFFLGSYVTVGEASAAYQRAKRMLHAGAVI